ncbi:MAG: CoA-binding protein [Acidaminococcales bacterium]|jgi:predicted CoA-binding protein|nr:CoA-binding protein [Acidaminococcales bacterium]
MYKDYGALLEKKCWAVAGVSENKENFAGKIYFALKDSGHTVYAINPRLEKFFGQPCYPSISALPVLPEVIGVVVRPQIGIGLMEEAARLGVRYIWLQPGANSPEAISRGEGLGLTVVADACVLAELAKKRWG